MDSHNSLEKEQDFFASLPSPLTYQIFSSLDLKSLIALSRVNKKWYRLAQEAPVEVLVFNRHKQEEDDEDFTSAKMTYKNLKLLFEIDLQIKKAAAKIEPSDQYRQFTETGLDYLLKACMILNVCGCSIFSAYGMLLFVNGTLATGIPFSVTGIAGGLGSSLCFFKASQSIHGYCHGKNENKIKEAEKIRDGLTLKPNGLGMEK